MIRVLLTACAFLVLLGANLALFGGAIWNRSGAPLAELAFTQCDFLNLTNHTGDDTLPRHLFLDAESRDIGPEQERALGLPEADAVPQAKFGFRDIFWRERRSYVLMAYGGTEWDAYAKTREHDRFWIRRSHGQRILVDGDPDLATLHQRLAPDNRHVILHGYIDKDSRYNPDLSRATTRFRWRIAHNRVAIDSDFRPAIREILANTRPGNGGNTCNPTHHIVLKWGQRHEPWVESIEPVAVANEKNR